MKPHSRVNLRFIAACPRLKPAEQSGIWCKKPLLVAGSAYAAMRPFGCACPRAGRFTSPWAASHSRQHTARICPRRRTRELGSGPCAVTQLMKRTAKRSNRHTPAYPMHAPPFPPCVQRAHQALSLSCWERTISRYSPQVAISSSWVPSPTTPPSDNTRMRSQ